jgi:hypothetical protein
LSQKRQNFGQIFLRKKHRSLASEDGAKPVGLGVLQPQGEHGVDALPFRVRTKFGNADRDEFGSAVDFDLSRGPVEDVRRKLPRPGVMIFYSFPFWQILDNIYSQIKKNYYLILD